MGIYRTILSLIPHPLTLDNSFISGKKRGKFNGNL